MAIHFDAYSTRLAAALVLGSAIGLERQWNHRMAGLRTNALVAIGSASFVMMGEVFGGDGAARIAAQIVSGIGFLGGGVILREGFNVRGLNTAATLWCSAAVGSMCGAGEFWFAILCSGAVLIANILLRPIAWRLSHVHVENAPKELLYRIRCTTRASDEAHVRAVLLQCVATTALSLTELESKDVEGTERVEVHAHLRILGRHDDHVERVVTRLSLESTVTAVAWQVVQEIDMEDSAMGV